VKILILDYESVKYYDSYILVNLQSLIVLSER